MKALWALWIKYYISILRIMPVPRVYPEEYSFSDCLCNLPVLAQPSFIKISISATQLWLNILLLFQEEKKNAANSWSPVSTGDMDHRDKLNP